MKYIKKQELNMGSKCIYTFIVGGYDNIKEPKIVTPGWDYICVTDNPNLKSDVWEFINIDDIDKKLEPAKVRAMSLMIGHKKYLPKHYDIVVTVGGQCVINIDLDELLVKYGYDDSYDACLCEHADRSCVYSEGETIIQVKRDTPERINKHLDFYREVGYPSNNGLYTSGMMIINNNSKNIHAYFKQWLSDYQTLPSIRDQMTMNYSEWKLNKDTGIKLNIKLLSFRKIFMVDRDIYTENHQQSHEHAMKSPNKIRIFQRHCNFSTQSEHKPRPDWFNREVIFDKLITSLDGRVEYTAFHDSGNGEIEDHFLASKNIKKISRKGGNDAQSFLNLLNYVNEQDYDDDDIIYFLEDDYLHRQGWIDILLEGFKHIGADYYTLYDHPDKYFLPMYENLQSKIIATPSTHWRTTPSTTNTYACKFKTLKQHFDIHVQYCDLIEKWTKDHDKFTHLWNIGSNLISCTPGYSTHVEGGMLSPTIKWGEI